MAKMRSVKYNGYRRMVVRSADPKYVKMTIRLRYNRGTLLPKQK